MNRLLAACVLAGLALAAPGADATPAQEDTAAVKGRATVKPGTAARVVGKDEKGRTIYEGPRGGRYYINAKGNKAYVRKQKK